MSGPDTARTEDRWVVAPAPPTWPERPMRWPQPQIDEPRPRAAVDPAEAPASPTALRAVARLALHVRAFALCTLGGAALTVVVAVLAGFFFFGYRGATVVTGSMRPAIDPGDVVLIQRIPASSVRIGDVVAYNEPTHRRRLITHRVRGVAVRNGKLDFETRGDANRTTERWSLHPHRHVGRIRAKVPKVGYAVHWLRGATGGLLLLLVPAVLLAALELWTIWRPRRSPTEAHAAAHAAASAVPRATQAGPELRR